MRPSRLFPETKIFLRIFVPAILFAVPLCAAEEEEAAQVKEDRPVSFAFEADFASHYLWRGFVVNNGPVLQPLASLSVYDFTLNLWSNLVLEEDGRQGKFTEVDPSLDYYIRWGRLEIQPSFEYFFYPNQTDAPSTGEFSVWFAYPVGPVRIFTDQVADVVRYPGAYFGDVGVDFERGLVSRLKMTAALTLAWATAKYNEANGGVDKAALNSLYWDLGFVYEPWSFLYLRPHMQVSVLLDPDLRRASPDPTVVSGGLALGVSF
ncbi:MAG TPA: hypothetical protein VLJ37_07745 [bacterium]|nr:hypothetical protein [bacterium]